MKEQERNITARCLISANGFGMSLPINSGEDVLLLWDLFFKKKRLITHYFHIFCLFAQLLNQITG